MAFNMLLVDDSDLIRASLVRLLQPIEGISRIDQATSLAHAMERVRIQPPDLVILDLHLPDGLGLEIIPPMKQLVPTLRVAVLTVHAQQGYRQRCEELGSDWFFDKTTELDDLLKMLHRQINLGSG